MEGLRRDGHISDVLGCSITLADIRITQGRLTDALRTYQDALRLAEDDPLPVTRGTADMHVGISGVAYERNDLATAAHHLQLSRELGDAAGLPQNPYRWRAAEARLLAAQGDLPGAIELLDEAEQVYFGDFAPNVRPVAARRTRLQLARGDLASATSWAAAHDLAADDELSYLREFEHITLAMVLLAQHRAGRSPAAVHVARRLLERLLAAAEAGGRTGNVIEILVQLALASEAEGDRGACHGPARSCPGPGRAPRATSGSSSTQDQHLSAVLHSVEPDSPGGRHARAVLAAGAQEPPRPDEPAERHTCDTGTAARRLAQRAGARRPAAARQRPGWARHRARAQRVGEHGADPHPPHLRQARRHHPTRSRPRSRTPGSAAPPQALTVPGPSRRFTACGPIRAGRKYHQPAHQM